MTIRPSGVGSRAAVGIISHAQVTGTVTWALRTGTVADGNPCVAHMC
jgi:hypothetical protein